MSNIVTPGGGGIVGPDGRKLGTGPVPDSDTPVTRVFVMRQVEVEFDKVKEGDIFRLVTFTKGQMPQSTDWALASQGSVEDDKQKGAYKIPCEKLHMIVGNMEKLELRNEVDGGKDFAEGKGDLN